MDQEENKSKSSKSMWVWLGPLLAVVVCIIVVLGVGLWFWLRRGANEDPKYSAEACAERYGIDLSVVRNAYNNNHALTEEYCGSRKNKRDKLVELAAAPGHVPSYQDQYPFLQYYH